MLALVDQIRQDALVTDGLIRIQPLGTPSERLRGEWAESLREHMDARLPAPMTRKELVAALDLVGCKVTVQAVGQWLRGETSPRPHHQAALSAVFQVPVRRLFPIEAAKAS